MNDDALLQEARALAAYWRDKAGPHKERCPGSLSEPTKWGTCPVCGGRPATVPSHNDHAGKLRIHMREVPPPPFPWETEQLSPEEERKAWAEWTKGATGGYFDGVEDVERTLRPREDEG